MRSLLLAALAPLVAGAGPTHEWEDVKRTLPDELLELSPKPAAPAK